MKENLEIYKLIDEGANYYCRQLGNASRAVADAKNVYKSIGFQCYVKAYDKAFETIKDKIMY